MKFLPPNLVTPNIIPLNFIYDKGGSDFGNDTLTIIFKDNVTGQKSSYTNPLSSAKAPLNQYQLISSLYIIFK